MARDSNVGCVVLTHRKDFGEVLFGMLNLFWHLSESHTVKNLGLFCFKNNDFFSSSSDRSRNEFGMTFLVLFFLIVARS